MSDRQRLAEAQAALVRGLLSGEPPDGFDAARFCLASRSLINKRLREVARAWPMLARCLGDRFAARFRAFAQTTTPPGEGGPLADGRAFLDTFPIHELDEAAREELLRVDLNWRRTSTGLRPRRGVVVKWIRKNGAIAVGIRMPGFGVRVYG